MPPEVSLPERFAFSHAGREAAQLSEQQRSPSQSWGTSSCLCPRSPACPSRFLSLCLSFPMHRGVTPALLERRVAFPVLSEIRRTPGSGDKLHTKEQKELLPMQFDGIAAEELRHVHSCSEQWSLWQSRDNIGLTPWRSLQVSSTH